MRKANLQGSGLTCTGTTNDYRRKISQDDLAHLEKAVRLPLVAKASYASKPPESFSTLC